MATNWSDLATKSVSDRSWTMEATPSACPMATAPSEASRSARLDWLARPCSRSHLTASSMSPSFSSRARLGVEHAHAGQLAELLDVLGGEVGHGSGLLGRRRRGSAAVGGSDAGSAGRGRLGCRPRRRGAGPGPPRRRPAAGAAAGGGGARCAGPPAGARSRVAGGGDGRADAGGASGAGVAVARGLGGSRARRGRARAPRTRQPAGPGAAGR